MSDPYSFDEDFNNPFQDPVDFVKAHQRATVANVISSLEDDPEKAVQSREIGKDLGVPPVVVKGDFDHFKQQHQVASVEQLIRNNKFLAQYSASNPLAASVSNDDWGNLDEISSNIRRVGTWLGVPYPDTATESIQQKTIKGFAEGFGEEPVGEWMKRAPGGAEFVAKYPASAFLYKLGGGLIEIPARAFSGLVHGGLAGIEEAYIQSGGDESSAKRFAQAIVGPLEHYAISGGAGMHGPTFSPKEIQRLQMKPIEAADMAAAKKIMEYVVRGEEPPSGISPIYDMLKMEETKYELDNLKQVESSVNASNTKSRSPDDMAEFLRGHVGEATIGIDASAIRQLYGDKPLGLDDGIFNGLITDEQLRLAETTGGDINIPLADWLARVEPDIQRELHNFVRLRPKGFNLEETKFFKEHETEVRAKDDADGIDEPLGSGDTTVDGVRAAAGMESPLDPMRAAKIKLERIAEDITGAEPLEVGAVHSFKLKDPTNKDVGSMSISEFDDGKKLYVNWIGAGPPSGRVGIPGFLGPRVVRDLLAQIKQEFPNAEELSGFRVSGARFGPGRGERPIQEARVKLDAPTEEELLQIVNMIRAGEPGKGEWVSFGGPYRAYIKPPEEYTPAQQAALDKALTVLDRVVPRDLSLVAGAEAIQTGKEGKVTRGTYIFYRDRLPVLLFSLLDPKVAPDIARHEAVHHLRMYNFFDEGEWKTLQEAAEKNDWIKAHNIDKRYKELDREGQLEESIAEAYRYWASGKAEPNAVLDKIWQKIKDLFEQIRQAMREVLGREPTFDDIFGKVERGEVGAREPGAPRVEGVYDPQPHIGPGDIRPTTTEELSAVTAKPRRLGAFKPKEAAPPHDVVREGRQALIKDANAIVEFAQKHGWSDEQVKALIDDNFSSPKYRAKTYADYLAAKEPKAKEARPEEPELPQAGTTRMEDRPPFARGMAIGMPQRNYRKILDVLHQRFQEDLASNIERFTEQERKRQSQEWKDNAAALRPEVAEKVLQRPDIAVDEFFRKGMIHGYRIPGRIPKIAREALTEEQRARIPEKYISEKGLNPDDIAGDFGYQSGDALIERLAMLQDQKKQAGLEGKAFLDKVTDEALAREMEKKYGKLAENIFQDAKDRAASDTQLRLIHEEILAVMGPEAELSITKAMLEEGLQTSFNGSQVRNVGSDAFLRDAGRAGKKAEFELLVRNDPKEFFLAKQAQYKATYLAKQALKFEKDMAKLDKLFDRWSVRNDPKAIDQGYLDWMHDIMYRLDRPPKRTIQDWETEVAAADRPKTFSDFVTSVESGKYRGGLRELQEVPDWLIDPAFRSKLEDLTVEQARQVHNAMANLSKVGKDEMKVKLGDKQYEFEVLRDEMLANISTFAPKIYDAQGRRWMAGYIPPKIANEIRNYGYAHLQMETIFNRIDRGNPYGVFTQTMFRRLADAATRERTLEREYSKMILDLKDSKVDRKKLYDNPFIMDPFSLQRADQGIGEPVPLRLNKEAIRAIVLNMGNRSNREGFLRGYRIPEESWPAFDTWLQGVTDKEDWAWAQRYGNVFQHFWDNQAAPLYRELNGVAPVQVDIQPFANQHGEFRGWYYPKIHHPLYEGTSRKLMGGDALEGEHYTRATTPNGYIERRTGYVAPIDLSLDRGVTRLKQAIHDVAFREAIIEASKFYYDKDIRAAIAQHYGKEARDLLTPYLKDIANSANVKNEVTVAAGGLIEAARQNLIGVLIGWNPATVAKHGFTAFVQSGYEIGWKNLMDAYASLWSKDDLSAETNWQFAKNNSEEIASRHRHYMETMRGGSENLFKTWTWRDFMLYSGSYFVSRSDLMSAVPLWLASYKKALAETGKHEDAVYVADRSVRRAHGSTAITSRPQITREGNMWFTSLYTFFNHIMNRQYEIAWRAADAMDKQNARLLPGETRTLRLVRQPDGTYAPQKFKAGAAAVPGLAAALTAYLLYPALIEELVSPLPHDEEDSFFKIAGKGLLKTLSSSWAGYGVRDIANAVLRGQDPTAGLVSTAFKQATDVFRDLKKDEPFNEDNAGATLQHAINLFGFVTGITNGEMGRKARYMYDLTTDKEKAPESASEWWNVLVHSTTEYPRPRGGRR